VGVEDEDGEGESEGEGERGRDGERVRDGEREDSPWGVRISIKWGVRISGNCDISVSANSNVEKPRAVELASGDIATGKVGISVGKAILPAGWQAAQNSSKIKGNTL